MVDKITITAKIIYNHTGNVMYCLKNGIYISVPFPKAKTNIKTYIIEIIDNPSILSFGLIPSVLCKKTFLKSSTNPTTPNPNVTKIIGNSLVAISGSSEA